MSSVVSINVPAFNFPLMCHFISYHPFLLYSSTVDLTYKGSRIWYLLGLDGELLMK